MPFLSHLLQTTALLIILGGRWEVGGGRWEVGGKRKDKGDGAFKLSSNTLQMHRDIQYM